MQLVQCHVAVRTFIAKTGLTGNALGSLSRLFQYPHLCTQVVLPADYYIVHADRTLNPLVPFLELFFSCTIRFDANTYNICVLKTNADCPGHFPSSIRVGWLTSKEWRSQSLFGAYCLSYFSHLQWGLGWRDATHVWPSLRTSQREFKLSFLDHCTQFLTLKAPTSRHVQLPLRLHLETYCRPCWRVAPNYAESSISTLVPAAGRVTVVGQLLVLEEIWKLFWSETFLALASRSFVT